jgi:hypothetical protein
MIGAPTLRCPECGHTATHPTQFYRTRRRYRWTAIAVILSVLAPVLAASAWLQNAAAHPLRLTWHRRSDRAIAGYTVRSLVQRSGDGVEFGQRISILKNGELLYQVDGWRLTLGGQNEHVAPFGVGEDVTGAGYLDLIIQDYSGGAHCCFTYYVLELGPSGVRPLATIDAGHGAAFEDLDDDGLPEFVGRDWTFAYWNESFAGSPAPRVVMKWKNGRYVLAADLMRKPAPSAAELAQDAARVRTSVNDYARDMPPSTLWRQMLDLIYTGHESLAWEFFDSAWPEDLPGKDKFLADFKRELARSPYWPDVRALSLE